MPDGLRGLRRILGLQAQPPRQQPDRGPEALQGTPFPVWFGEELAPHVNHLWCAVHPGGGRYLPGRECFSDPAMR